MRFPSETPTRHSPEELIRVRCINKYMFLISIAIKRYTTTPKGHNTPLCLIQKTHLDILKSASLICVASNIKPL